MDNKCPKCGANFVKEHAHITKHKGYRLKLFSCGCQVEIPGDVVYYRSSRCYNAELALVRSVNAALAELLGTDEPGEMVERVTMLKEAAKEAHSLLRRREDQ
jgi:hypothetical protein